MVSLSLKSSFKSNSTRHLYEFAEELAAFDDMSAKQRIAAEITDTTAAKNAAAKWKRDRAAANPLADS